ncbi:hypothetical protein RMSM_00053 [Rhodopirellula maiorica SM1]|uniref:Uncharacterized protein n=1 Tax=Rhodopirellula maiorica SM1 TaxID=1265738 RepID=M5RV01_9BACT|nr:hypothetical protein RMSM_00053 [Rhodopirellula maiorica SM1]
MQELTSADPIDVIERKYHWVAVLEDGSIELDKRDATVEQVVQVYSTLNKHDAIHFLGKNPDLVRSTYRALGEASAGLKNGAAKLLGHPTTMTLDEFYAYNDDDSNSAATEASIIDSVRSLICGNASGSESRYAAEHLCRAIGHWLDDGDTLADIAPLQLDTKLADSRDLPNLENDGDFPIISYLTSKEVKKEIKRLGKIDLSYPADDDIDAARKAFVRCLVEADASNSSVVAFYR